MIAARWRRRAAGTVLAVGALVTLAVAPANARPDRRAPEAATTFPPFAPTRVLALGDSVMKGAEGQIPIALDGRDVTVDAEVNRSTNQGAEVIVQRGADWDVAVVMLGHNDGGSPGVFQPAARRILDQLREVPRVVWLSIHEVRDYYPAVNRYIADLQAEYPNLRIADWNAVAAGNPGSVAGDGLHLSSEGARLMADLVAESVSAAELEFAAAIRALAPPTTTTTTTTTTTAPPTTTATTEATTSTTEVAPEEPAPSTPAVAPEEEADGSAAPLVLGGAAVVVVAGVAGWAVRRRRGDPS